MISLWPINLPNCKTLIFETSKFTVWPLIFLEPIHSLTSTFLGAYSSLTMRDQTWWPNSNTTTTAWTLVFPLVSMGWRATTSSKRRNIFLIPPALLAMITCRPVCTFDTPDNFYIWFIGYNFILGISLNQILKLLVE